jgi:hypothetical protein
VNDSQKIDHAYHEEKLIRLVSRRDKLEPSSNQMPAILREINETEQLVRSYQLVRDMEMLSDSGLVSML